MLLDAQELLKPEKQNIYLHKLLRLPIERRADELCVIAPINVLLAAVCWQEMRKSPTKQQLRDAILTEARQQAQNVTDSKQARRGLEALYKLGAEEDVAAVFSGITEASLFHRELLLRLLANASDEFCFKIIDTLFNNYHANENPTTLTIWLWILEIIHSDLAVSKSRKLRLLDIYKHFSIQVKYNNSLHLLYRRFPSLQKDFLEVLKGTDNYITHMTEIYIRQLKTKSEKFDNFLFFIKKIS